MLFELPLLPQEGSNKMISVIEITAIKVFLKFIAQFSLLLLLLNRKLK